MHSKSNEVLSYCLVSVFILIALKSTYTYLVDFGKLEYSYNNMTQSTDSFKPFEPKG